MEKHSTNYRITDLTGFKNLSGLNTLKHIILLIFALFLVKNNFAQHFNKLKNKTFETTRDTIFLDSLSIVPKTVFIFDKEEKEISDTLFQINYVESCLILDKTIIENNKKIKVFFRVFPFFFKEKLAYKSLSLINYDTFAIKRKTYEILINNSQKNYFNNDKLQKTGSISRGINFGNNQDMIVNSNMNLQLSGKLNEKINIIAVISDNNVPIQPDGNSQQIQDFDKVFIKLFTETSHLTVGDFELEKPKSYFMNFYKKVQGGSFEIQKTFFEENQPKIKKFALKHQVSGAVSKGKYRKQNFNGIEGNQGAYQLQGANNESFIIVLAGSEKVYIDGKLLKRGQENDYIVDYNTAEITFTPNQPITKDKRIVVEFEYSEKSYARFLLFSNNEFHSEKHHFFINAFSESDSKNQPLQQDLSKEQKQMLSEIGDSLHLAIVPNIKEVEFSDEYILYKKIDTLNVQNIYVNSTNSDSAIYQLGFSFVGENQGNYVIEKRLSNGRVYKWVKPENNIPQGSYEPKRLLKTPQKKQMLTFGSKNKWSDFSSSEMEFAFSNYDLNTFSTKNNNDNIGFALKTKYKQGILKKDTSNLKLETSLNYELVEKNFTAIEDFRDVEFQRNFNLTNEHKNVHQHLLSYHLDFSKRKLLTANYQLDFLNFENKYRANNNLLNVNFEKNNYQVKTNTSFLNSKSETQKTQFLRYEVEANKKFLLFTFGVKNTSENNQFYGLESDNLQSNSFKFYEYAFFLQTPDTFKTKFSIHIKNRNDFLAKNNAFKNTTSANDLESKLSFLKNPRQTLSIIFNYRKLNVKDTILSENEDENNISTRLEYHGKFLKNFLSLSSFYEVASGLEQKQEFSYQKVADGQGVYQWIDYNNNKIKDLDEFEIAKFADQASYIRVFHVSKEYKKVYSNEFNQNIALRPRRLWKKEKGFKKFVSKFSNNFVYRIKQQTNERYFQAFIVDENEIVTLNSSLKNIFSWNKTHSKYGIDYILQKNQMQTFLIDGFDVQDNYFNGLRMRWYFRDNLSLNNETNLGKKKLSSESFKNKNYEIQYWDNELTFTFQSELSLQVSLFFHYEDKKNILGSEQAKIKNLGTESKYNFAKNANLSLEFSYISIAYNGDMNSSLAYTMLEALQKGDNFTWVLRLQKNISKNLQLSLNYNGRTAENQNNIHMGNAEVKAFF